MPRLVLPVPHPTKKRYITFEKEFSPSIFPLGSQNGGGKSTLLQLIFVLLHCSIDPEQIPYLKNMLRGFKIANDDKKTLAIIDIWNGDKNVKLEFIACKDKDSISVKD